MEKLKVFFEKAKNKFPIFLVIAVLIAIVLIPPMIFANFNIKYYGAYYYQYIELVNEAFSAPFARLIEIMKVKELTAEGTLIEGSSYVFEYFRNYFLIFFALYLFIVYRASKVEDDYVGKEYGSSDWASKDEIYKDDKFSKKDGIILAENVALPIDKGHGNKNVLVVGNTGSGKSAGFVFPNVKQNLGSYVFTDPKGEIFDYSAGYFKSQGYDIKVLNLSKPSLSDGYNPLNHIEADEDSQTSINIDIVADTIVMGQSDNVTSEAYWTDNAKTLLKALIRFLMDARPKEEQNLTSCSNLVRMASSSGPVNVLSQLMKALPPDHLARKDYESVELASDKAFSSILSTLQSVLSKFDSPAIAELTATNTIDFKQIGKKKTAVYVISPDTHSTYDFLLTIFFSQMIQKLYELADENGGALEIPVVFFLDEFANVGRIPDFERKISTARSRKLSFNIILQNLEQLEAIYGDASETISGNCGTHLFLGSTSAKTLEYFSRNLGLKTIEIKDDKKEEEESHSRSQKLGRELMTPDEIRRLPFDECLIYASGTRPIKGKKNFYFKHKEQMIPESMQVNHNTYKVERGEWRAFSIYNNAKGSPNTGVNTRTKTGIGINPFGLENTKTQSNPLNIKANIPLDELGKSKTNSLNNENKSKKDTLKDVLKQSFDQKKELEEKKIDNSDKDKREAQKNKKEKNKEKQENKINKQENKTDPFSEIQNKNMYINENEYIDKYTSLDKNENIKDGNVSTNIHFENYEAKKDEDHIDFYTKKDENVQKNKEIIFDENNNNKNNKKKIKTQNNLNNNFNNNFKTQKTKEKAENNKNNKNNENNENNENNDFLKKFFGNNDNNFSEKVENDLNKEIQQNKMPLQDVVREQFIKEKEKNIFNLSKKNTETNSENNSENGEANSTYNYGNPEELDLDKPIEEKEKEKELKNNNKNIDKRLGTTLDSKFDKLFKKLEEKDERDIN